MGTQKPPKSQKNEVPKSIKIQNDLKEPPKADLHRFGVARTFKKQSKKESKMIFESEITDFLESAYFIGPADARRGSST